MSKRIFVALLVISIMIGATIAVSADATFDKNVANLNVTFEQGKPISGWIFDELVRVGGSVTLTADHYSLTFNQSDLTVQSWNSKYNLSLLRHTSGLLFDEYKKWVGKNTPKYAFLFAEGEVLPGKATLTLISTSFSPLSKVYVYRRTKDFQYETIALDVETDKNRNISFPVTMGGEYLVSDIRVEDKVVPYNYDIPQYFDVNSLLTSETASLSGTLSSDEVKVNPPTGAK